MTSLANKKLKGPGPFTSWSTDADASGGTVLQTSRRCRKGLPGVYVDSIQARPHDVFAGLRNEWFRFWAPREPGWWIAVLFMIGSTLFTIGGAQGTWPQAASLQWIDARAVGSIFFVGSLFFTAAAYVQFLEALNGDLADPTAKTTARQRCWQFIGWRPRNLGFLASAIQLAGTVLFNINTVDALLAGLGWKAVDVLIWTPDMLGSICFLAASQFAVMEFSHRAWCFVPSSVSWWIVALNMLGSVLFQISALVSLVGPSTVALNPWLASFGTFSGAVCFFVGAYLLIPELFEKSQTVSAAGEQSGLS